jgi:multifunctional cyclase/dehydratase/O-methyltransferase
MGEMFFATFGELMHTVRTGTPAFDKVFGQSFFDFLSTHKKLGQLFDSQMTALYELEVNAVLNAYDFAGAGRILDLAAAEAPWLALCWRVFPISSAGFLTCLRCPTVRVKVSSRTD